MTTLRKLPMSKPKIKTKPATMYGDKYSIQAFRLRDAVKWIKLARRSIVKLGKRKGGGGEVGAAGLVGALAARGHAVSLAVRPNGPPGEPLAGVIASWHEMPL